MTAPETLRAVLAQARVEGGITLRRGESLLVTVIIPAALMVFFASGHFLATPGRAISFLLPGTLALAVISTGLVSLGIATAYERYYGVLKLLGSTPLPRAGLIGAKMLTVVGMEVMQVILLVAIAALGYGWAPHGPVILALLTLAVGTLIFTGLGLAMAGGMRAEATLAAANGLFLFFLLLGGLYVPLNHLPGLLVPLAQVLPAAPLGDALRATLNGTALPGRDLVVLGFWAIASPLLAVLAFRWE